MSADILPFERKRGIRKATTKIAESFTGKFDHSGMVLATTQASAAIALFYYTHMQPDQRIAKSLAAAIQDVDKDLIVELDLCWEHELEAVPVLAVLQEMQSHVNQHSQY